MIIVTPLALLKTGRKEVQQLTQGDEIEEKQP